MGRATAADRQLAGHALPILLPALLLGGCALPPSGVQQDGLGSHIPPASELADIPDATPRPETLSRYGNPPSYRVQGHEYRTLTSSRGYKERGIASWYGNKFHGRRTSSGEPYDMFAMTAAHKTLPLPTYARVTNLRNGRSVVVKINDRGPFHNNRLIDLSYAAAWKLGITAEGTGLVEVEALQARAPEPDPATTESHPASAPSTLQTKAAVDTAASTPPDPASAHSPRTAAVPLHRPAPRAKPDRLPELFLQVGAFSSRENARRLKSRLDRTLGTEVQILSGDSDRQPVYRVQLGPIASVELCDHLTERLGRIGISETHIVIR